jgi:hypothetical protein
MALPEALSALVLRICLATGTVVQTKTITDRSTAVKEDT